MIMQTVSSSSRIKLSTASSQRLVVTKGGEEVFARRWQRINDAGHLDNLYEIVDILVIMAHKCNEIEDVSDSFASLLPVAKRRFQQVLSFYDNRPVDLDFDIGAVLEALISQFLPTMSKKITNVLRYERIDTYEIGEEMLTKFEVSYRDWSISKLLPTLILDIYDDDLVQESNRYQVEIIG